MEIPDYEPGTPLHAAKRAWGNALHTAEQKAADYLTAAFPHLTHPIGDGQPRSIELSFNLPGYGHGTVVVEDPYCVTIAVRRLHRELWLTACNLAFPDGYHFDNTDDAPDLPPGAYSGECEERDAEDTLIIHPDGNADMTLYRLDVNEAAHVLAQLHTRIEQIATTLQRRNHPEHRPNAQQPGNGRPSEV